MGMMTCSRGMQRSAVQLEYRQIQRTVHSTEELVKLVILQQSPIPRESMFREHEQCKYLAILTMQRGIRAPKTHS